ncbi:MAG TPA: flagellar motor switch protein FliM, partial [Chroococcales cyanobacterium]
MGDILSQAEIDALLSALSSGSEVVAEKPQAEVADEPARMVRLYDFRRQDKFSKEHIRTLWMLHEGFARILSTALSAHLRMMVQLEVVAVEQLTFDEYGRSLPNPTILNVFTLPPLVGNSLFEVNLDTASIIIDRMLGGPGKVTRIRRDLSDIERTLMGTVFDR